MANKIYALLIAIDSYRHPVPPLSGCVQDSKEVQAYLEGTIPSDQLKLQTLRNEQATRKNVVDAFLSHLSQAGSEDTVFIHYSGHGSQEKTHEAFYDLEPDHKNETLVLYDSRQTIDSVYHRDLADKELRALLHQVARKNPHIVTIFDCCHSGSNTRDTAKVTKRQASDDQAKARDLKDYVFMERSEFADTFQKEFANGKMVNSELPTGSHIALQGSLSSQTAKELVIDGKKRGIFTYSILKFLKESQGDISYDELISKSTSFVSGKVAEQNPQLDVVFSLKTSGAKVDANMVFLKGSLKSTDKSYMVQWDQKRGSWTLSGGQLNGIPATGVTRFAIYDSQADIAAKPSEYLEVAQSKEVDASVTTISFDGTATLSHDATFKATILSLPITKTKIYFEAETAAQANGVKLLEAAFKQDADAQKYLELVAPDAEADYKIMAYAHERKEKFGFFRPTDARALSEPLAEINSRQAENALKIVSGIARWDRTQSLANATTNIPQGTLQLEVEAHHFDPQTDQLLKVEPVTPNSKGEIAIAFQIYGEITDSSWGRTPVYKVKVKNNHSSQDYHVAVLAMGSDFSIQNILFGQNVVGPGQSIFVAGGDTLAPNVPEALVNKGIRQDTTYLKMVASTEPFKASLMEQSGFDYPQRDRSVGNEEGMDSFSILLEEQQTRSLIIRKPKKVTDWTTALISMTNIWDDKASDEQVVAKSAVSVKFPSGTNGKVKLSSIGHASRSVQAELPGTQAFRSIPNSQPFELVAGQNASPGMEILEIEGLDRSSVSKENPLVLTFDTELGADDQLVIVQEDDGILLPWFSESNADGKPEISLDRLTTPATAERSLSSSVKLVVHRLLGGKFGISEFPYPRLGVAGLGEDGFEFTYEKDAVQSAIAASDKIMILIHGFTSSCKECFFADMEEFPEQSLYSFLKKEGGYDTVLVFDYETLNTRIAETSKLLKDQLEAVGLGAGHGKELNIIAHSMGGLVSRYFIEMLDGNKVVNHLIVAGTPSGGSPWLSIKQWATFGSTLLLNGLTGLGWGIAALGYLFGAVKAADQFLEFNSEAMTPGSEFLKNLHNAPDPGIPYTAFAGSLTMIPDEGEKMVGKILDKIGIGDPQFSSLKKYIFGDENDIFVGVGSVNNIPAERKFPIQFHKVPCNHFGFFVPDGGLPELQKAILSIKNSPSVEEEQVDRENANQEDQEDQEVEVEIVQSEAKSEETGFWAWLKSLFGM